jgi:acyl carrier protein
MTNKAEVLKYIGLLLEKKQALPTHIQLQDYRYIEAGHIDSLGIMKFIIQIEDEFKIEINDDDMLSDLFQSVGGLVELILGKLN